MRPLLTPLSTIPTAADLCQQTIEALGSPEYAQADFETILKVVLCSLGRGSGWPFGEVWIPDPHHQRLYCGSMGYADVPHLQGAFRRFRKASLALWLEAGQGVPGRVLRSRRPEWIDDVSHASGDEFLRQPLAQACGLGAALAVPLRAGQQVLAVLVFFGDRPEPYDRDRAVPLERAAAQLGPILRQYQQADRYRQIFQHSLEGIFQMAPNGHYLHANPVLAKMLGYRSPEALLASLNGDDRHFYTAQHAERELRSQLEAHGEVRGFCAEVYRQDGTRLWIEQTLRAVHDHSGRLLYYEGSVLDVTKHHSIAAQLHYNAFHDELTGLKNQTWLLEALAEAIARRRQDANWGYGLLFLDLDRFHRINESFNHATGDRLLLAFTSRIEHCLEAGATLTRVGGDEFAILLEPLTAATTAPDLARKLQQALHAPFPVDDRDVFLQIRIGIAQVLPGESRCLPTYPQEVWRDATAALARAKRLGQGTGGWAVFDAAAQSDTREQLELESDLHWAIERGEFFWEYQPVVDLASDRLVGFEALIRWQHPRWGRIGPDRFIPLAEEQGAIVELGALTLREVCRTLDRWQRLFSNAQPPWISANLSPLQLHPEALERLDRILDTVSLPAGALKLEITETALAVDPDRTREALQHLRDRGVHLCLDDFGTGYCSLNYLNQFPIDTIKIDRAFIQSLPHDPRNRAIVHATLMLARNLGLSVVAEGIETEAQAHYLRRSGCTYGQGYRYSPARPIQQIEQFLTTLIPFEGHRAGHPIPLPIARLRDIS